MPARVAVALSGGVDSAVAAALLLEQGWDVIGVTMRIWHEPPLSSDVPPLPDPANGAGRVAEVLGIPLHVIDAAVPFKQHVVDRFIAEYSAGRTPNPCLYCNRRVKFGYLFEQALVLSVEHFATGHYARVYLAPDGSAWQLLRGVDRGKDQSYVLYVLGQRELSRVIFPLGELTKDRVRQMALERGLHAAHTEESQDLCFVCDGDYRRFLLRYAPQAFAPGPILDTSGREIGRHKGLAAYTIGQRGGMGIAAPEALYVLRIDVARNALIAGPKCELGRDRLTACEVNWISGLPPEASVQVNAKIRYRAGAVQATVTPLPDASVEVVFVEPLRDITPGQGIVFYRDDMVLGGGIITF
ncbi:MAG: tRNA 2-thiouridine(34) synthase MnmA [Anaerolineae bacterium]|nr:tRNA 2-thiouridine(34) synthase MnmA [Anaerolineae bacterium]